MENPQQIILTAPEPPFVWTPYD